MTTRNSSPPIPAGKIEAANGPADTQREFPQNLVTRCVSIGIVDCLEMVDVEHEDGKRLAERGGLLHESADMPFHVAPIMETGQRIRNRQLQGFLHIIA